MLDSRFSCEAGSRLSLVPSELFLPKPLVLCSQRGARKLELKLKAIRSDLIRAVYRARKVAPEKGTMPILGHVVLRADKELNRLLVEGTDLMTGVSGVLVADVEQGGAIAVGASAFYRIVDAATSDVVEIQGDETALLIRSGRSKWKLPTMLAADHPGMPEMKGAGESTEFDSETLRSALSQSAYAAGKFNDGNEATKGVLFQSRGESCAPSQLTVGDWRLFLLRLRTSRNSITFCQPIALRRSFVS